MNSHHYSLASHRRNSFLVILWVLVFYAQPELKKPCFRLNSILWSVKRGNYSVCLNTRMSASLMFQWQTATHHVAKTYSKDLKQVSDH